MNKKTGTKPITTVLFMVLATMLSKVLGLIREMLLAAHYGAGNTAAEAFSSAQSIPSSFFDILLSAAILGCFIPVYNGFGKDGKEADRFASSFLNIINIITGAMSILGIIFAEQLISVMTPGLDGETAVLAARLLRIMFPMIIFTGSAYTLVGIMQSKDRFLLPALISAISNGGVIMYFVFIDGLLGDRSVYGLAIAYALSWLVQLLTLAVPLFKSGFRFKAVIDLKSPQMIKALKMIPPIMIGSWLLPSGLLIGKYFASSFGGVAVFNYANQSYIMIAGILSYSICNYVFPKLSKLSNEGDELSFNASVRTGMLSSWFIIIPFMAALHVLSGEGMAILYMRGEFSPASAKMTADAVSVLAFAMPAFAIIEFCSRMFYSKKNTSAPMVAALVGVSVNILCSSLTVKLISADIVSVSIANALGQICAAAVLIISACMKDRKLFDRSFVLQTLKLAAGGVCCYAAMRLSLDLMNNDPFASGPIKNIAVVFAVFIPGALVYLLICKILKLKITGKEEHK
ncbi:MAG: murein biosynthesis integral membrane protein MurJ [Ruminococcaceae bacterium]|nr:murein biosynthesis integral membrane protein MurJ [Oscillospiraceae bacterium]